MRRADEGCVGSMRRVLGEIQDPDWNAHTETAAVRAYFVFLGCSGGPSGLNGTCVRSTLDKIIRRVGGEGVRAGGGLSEQYQGG
jgi:hypothetical protein